MIKHFADFCRLSTSFPSYEFILVLILRLRQLCCHPYLTLVCPSNLYIIRRSDIVQSLTDGSGEPAVLVATDSEKELNRAKKIMGMAWVNQVG